MLGTQVDCSIESKRHQTDIISSLFLHARTIRPHSAIVLSDSKIIGTGFQRFPFHTRLLFLIYDINQRPRRMQHIDERTIDSVVVDRHFYLFRPSAAFLGETLIAFRLLLRASRLGQKWTAPKRCKIYPWYV